VCVGQKHSSIWTTTLLIRLPRGLTADVIVATPLFLMPPKWSREHLLQVLIQTIKSMWKSFLFECKLALWTWSNELNYAYVLPSFPHDMNAPLVSKSGLEPVAPDPENKHHPKENLSRRAPDGQLFTRLLGSEPPHPVGRSPWLGHIISSSHAEKVWAPLP